MIGATVERSVADWDGHVAACGACLARGLDLCYEGEYLASRVADARATSVQPGRRATSLRLRGLILPGLPA